MYMFVVSLLYLVTVSGYSNADALNGHWLWCCIV